MFGNLPPTSDTIQFGIARLAMAKTSAAKKRAPEIMLNLSIFFFNLKQSLYGFQHSKALCIILTSTHPSDPPRHVCNCPLFSVAVPGMFTPPS